MNRAFKWIIITISALIIAGVTGWQVFKSVISSMTKEECVVVETWQVENYDIIKKQCIGFAGPPYYPLYLYQADTKIDRVNVMTDSCIVKFKGLEGDSLTFDICKNKLERKREEQLPTKAKANAG